eukprot:TRINITY_DN6339_c0_g1_i1.p1 TRINITY_DN6339_c0_g1~~TRINITY_DN6339_c0_g1_i1.p1  ORF type:complete len:353 (+),score=151.78 TRINITY_DN6339_c0_g1_i1:81-1061(+)
MSILIATKYGAEGKPKNGVDRRAVFSTAEPITQEFSDEEGEEVEWKKAEGQEENEEEEDEPIDYRFGRKPPQEKKKSDDGIDYEELYKQAKNEAESLNDRVEGLCEIIDSGEKEIEVMQQKIEELENQLTEAQQRRRKSSISATVEAARRAAESKPPKENEVEAPKPEPVEERKETDRKVSGAVKPNAETLSKSPSASKDSEPTSPTKKDTKKKGEDKLIILDGVVKEGFLVKQGKVVKNWKTRWFVLTEASLNYYNNQEKKHLKRSIPMTTIMSCRVDPKLSTRFYIHTKDRVFKCVTGDQGDRKDWAMKINKTLLSSIEKFIEE